MEIGQRYKFRKLPSSNYISEKEFHILSLSGSYVRIQIVGMSRSNSIHIRDWNFFVQPDPIILIEPSQGKLPFKFV